MCLCDSFETFVIRITFRLFRLFGNLQRGPDLASENMRKVFLIFRQNTVRLSSDLSLFELCTRLLLPLLTAEQDMYQSR